MVSATAATAATRDARRLVRHRETRDEIVDHAIDIMGTEGVLGLSLGELARRLGIRTPSLYTYFASKNALYDELFRRGWQECHDVLADLVTRLGPVTQRIDVCARAWTLVEANARWSVSNPALAQLMFFRPVPQWEPTPDAYAPSLAVFAMLTDELTAYRELGLLRSDIPLDEMVNNTSNLGAGVISRHLGNEPGTPWGQGAAERHFRAAFDALFTSYLPRSLPPGTSAAVRPAADVPTGSERPRTAKES